MPDNANVIHQIFQQYLGRNPNQYELQGFAGALQNGILDPISLTQFVQSTAEFQQRQIPQQAQAMAGQLQPLMENYQKSMMGQAYDVAQSRAAQQGRQESSSLGAQFAQQMGQMTGQTSQALAGQVGGYLGQAYGGLSTQQQGYGQAYPQAQQKFVQNQWQAGQNAIESQTYAGYYDRAMRQAKENQWFQLGGSLIGAAGSWAGGRKG